MRKKWRTMKKNRLADSNLLSESIDNDMLELKDKTNAKAVQKNPKLSCKKARIKCGECHGVNELS